MTEYYFTAKGYQKLKDEINELERFIKHDISKEIAAARDLGDLSENAEYHAAKDKQATYMTKLGQLQERFRGARIVKKDDLPSDIITFGKRVVVKDVDSGEEKTYVILGEGETDVEKGIISYRSPLAKALLRHRKGDVVDVHLPRGLKQFGVLEIEFFDDD